VSALAFARALLARWDRRVVWPGPLGLVFRTPPLPGRPPRAREAVRPLVLPRLHRSLNVDLRPAISLTVVRPAAETTRVERIEAGSERVDLSRLVIRNTSALLAERMLERALSRSRRVELLVRAEHSVTPAPAGDRMRAALPPELVVQRGTPAPPDPRGEPESDRPPAAPLAVREPAAPELDLGRLTDQVVSAIDGRLTVHAERLGHG
jgi:hypothetical protein